jgi:hypothetical protein
LDSWTTENRPFGKIEGRHGVKIYNLYKVAGRPKHTIEKATVQITMIKPDAWTGYAASARSNFATVSPIPVLTLSITGQCK